LVADAAETFSRALRDRHPDSPLEQLELLLQRHEALEQLGIRHLPDRAIVTLPHPGSFSGWSGRWPALQANGHP
jgi:hypothetical protein